MCSVEKAPSRNLILLRWNDEHVGHLHNLKEKGFSWWLEVEVSQDESRVRVSFSMSLMTVTFLGTASGGGPTESRNCSSLVCDILADESLWSKFYSFIYI